MERPVWGMECWGRVFKDVFLPRFGLVIDSKEA
jgi:hypothetical protein